MKDRKRRLIASLLSFIIVGTGQLYRKRYAAGISFLLLAVSSALFFKIVWNGFNYAFFAVLFAWIVLWAVNITDAYKGPFYPNAPCEDACPAGIKASDYVTLIACGRFDEAFESILRKTPFVGILGRVCHAPCEDKCSRSGVDTTIAIRYLKRSLEFKVQSLELKDKGKFRIQKKIAVIGGGPCGLTCAYELRKKGYSVIIFEREKEPGGMLVQCIPEYRLPIDIVKQEIELMEKGIEIKRCIEIGRDISFEDIEREFDAVFIATGAGMSNRLEIEGENLAHYGLDFLKLTKSKEQVELGTSVVVIGGGDVAIDVARSAKRLGASRVCVVCLESIENMPAKKSEIDEAIKERIEIRHGWGVSQISGKTQVSGVKLVKCTSAFDQEDSFNPSFDENTRDSIDCNTVIIAIGQQGEFNFLHNSIGTSKMGTLLVDKHMRTNKSGVFAGGDAVIGPSSVAEAIGAGKLAAKSIDRYLRGWKAKLDNWLDFDERPHIGKVEEAAWLEKNPKEQTGIRIPLIEDRSDFKEIETNSAKEEVIKEAKRCLRCPYRFW